MSAGQTPPIAELREQERVIIKLVSDTLQSTFDENARMRLASIKRDALFDEVVKAAQALTTKIKDRTITEVTTSRHPEYSVGKYTLVEVDLLRNLATALDSIAKEGETKQATTDAWLPISTHQNDGTKFLATWAGTNQFSILTHDSNQTMAPPTHWQPLKQANGGGE